MMHYILSMVSVPDYILKRTHGWETAGGLFLPSCLWTLTSEQIKAEGVFIQRQPTPK